MKTLEQIVEDALEELERPDLLNEARKRAVYALQGCHAAHSFPQDIQEDTAVSLDSDGKAVIILPNNFRKFSRLVAYDASGAELIGVVFADRMSVRSGNYFGAQADATYFIAGGSIRIECTGTIPATVAVEYYAHPEIAVEDDGSISSTSWILNNFERAVENALIVLLSKLTGMSAADRAMYSEAANQAILQLMYSEIN